MKPVACEAGDLTPEWLTAALGREVRSVTVTPIGTGQIGTSLRLELDWDGGPASLVAKLAGGDEAARQRVADGYRNEVAFYTEVATTVDVRTPSCWYGAVTDDACDFTLLLDDIREARPGVQADGCTVDQAADAVDNLARLHAPRWGDPTLADLSFATSLGTDPAMASFLGDIFSEAVGQFLERYPDADGDTLRAVAEALPAWVQARDAPDAILHGDYRLDNLMFPLEGPGVTALDWQTVSVGPALRDLAYFLGNSLETPLRRSSEESLVAGYHAALVGRGVDGYDADRCWHDYRLGQLQGPLITVLGAIFATAERSDRADGMFMAMARRSCAAIADLRSLELL